MFQQIFSFKKKPPKRRLNIIVTGAFSIPGKGIVLQLKYIGHNISYIDSGQLFALDPSTLKDIDLLILTSKPDDIHENAIVSWWKKVLPAVPLLVATYFEAFEPIIEGIKLGVSGYTSPAYEHAQLADAVQETAVNNNYIFDLPTERLLYSRTADIGDPLRLAAARNLPLLSRKVLCLLATTKSYEEIANDLQLAAHSLSDVRSQLSDALSFKSRVGLALFFIKNYPALADIYN